MATGKFGPKSADHPGIGTPCPACQTPFVAGDYTTLVAHVARNDPEERRELVHNVVAVEVHWACATGEVTR
jgi:hypothetical protein